MKINKAIMSVDDNPLFEDFWEPVSKVWRLRFNITPVLIYFGTKKLSTEWGEVIYVTPIADVPLYFQTQWARFWYTSQEPETIFCISDIDMFPVSKDAFVLNLKDKDEECYLHLRGDIRPLPVCYHVAKGKIFKEVLKLKSTFADSVLEAFNSGLSCASHMDFNKWGLDESFSTHKVLSSTYSNIMLLNGGPWPRLDRSKWVPNYEDFSTEGIKDIHSIRPYLNYKLEIDRIVSRLIS